MEWFLQKTAELEATMEGPHDVRAWLIYDSGKDNLNGRFFPILKQLGFSSLDHARDALHRSGKLPVGLEIAGQGRVFDELGLYAVANCLAFPRFITDSALGENRLRRMGAKTTIALVPGDITEPETWRLIRMRLQQESFEAPRFLLLTPAGGADRFPEGKEFIERVIKPTLVTAGRPYVLLGETPEQSSCQLERFLLALKAENGASVTLSPFLDESCLFGIFML